jgi:hormone-sensitive lipase
VRILHHKELPLVNGPLGKEEEIEDIIVHMHGGGFVGLSSHTTQNYTRPWASELKMPVFSIDYRMPPTHPFPHAPNDCFQVYKFLVNHLHKYMRIRPKNIYVCGDSAGGNLSCSLTALAMKNNILKPKALFLAYPCVDTRMIYYPSRKFVINDPLIWPSIGQMFFNAYTN